MLKLYIYCKKVGKKIQNSVSPKLLQFLLVLFGETCSGAHPIFRTVILVHLKETGLFMKKFVGAAIAPIL